ncbi:MAG: DNA primase [Porphyromonadaceae bacterium]|nr:DNA primase [Porphyromonadaceae bacterium]
MIDPATKQAILDRAQILDVVSDFVSLRRSGVSYIGLCPFHSDRRPSFSVSPSKNVCKCFSCGEGGSPVHFIMKHEQLTYTEALRYLAKKYHIEIIEREVTDAEREAENERQSLFLVNEFAQSFFHKNLLSGANESPFALAYFRERGIRPETIEKFGLGYAPEARTALTDEARAKGYSVERLVSVGLSAQYDDGGRVMDRFRGRIIFPVRNLGGKYVAFGGRIMGKSEKVAKYINSPESPIYSKSRELYGLYWAKNAIAKADKCYLVEGYTDVISLHQSGIENVVASSGTALTVAQIRLIRRFTEHVTVLYDGDWAGIKAALRGIDLLLEEGLSIKVVLLPEGEDPDSYARRHSTTELQTFLSDSEVDFIQFKINLYAEDMKRDPLRRAELVSDVLRSIALIPDAIRRAVYIQASAKDLRMDEQLLAGEIAKLRQRGHSAAGSYQPPQPRPVPQLVGQGGATQPAVVSGTPSVSPIEPSVSPQGAKPTLEINPYEQELLKLVISRGNELVVVDLSEGHAKEAPWEEVSVVSLIKQELEYSQLLSSLSSIAQQVIAEADLLDSSISCAAYFVNHHSESIRRISTDILSNPYAAYESASEQDNEERLTQESLIRQRKRLGVEVLRELDNIRMQVLMQDIHVLQTQMLSLQREESPDMERIMKIMTEINELNQLKISFAQILGERTIVL